MPEHVAGPLLWLNSEPLPPTWETFAKRPVVFERPYLTDDIIANSGNANVQMPGILEVVESKRYTTYLDREFEGFVELTRLFYASLRIIDANTLRTRVGGLEFSFTRNDVALMFENDIDFINNTTPYWTEEFQATIPDIEKLIQDLFIVPTKKKEVLNEHTDLYIATFMLTNVCPYRGNHTALTAYLIRNLFLIKRYTPCLGYMIFDHMCNIVTNKKPVALGFPDLIRRLLIKFGFKFPRVHESPIRHPPYKAEDWQKVVVNDRCAAFLARGWNLTECLVIGGEEVGDDHELYKIAGTRKRKEHPGEDVASMVQLAHPAPAPTLHGIAQFLSSMYTSMVAHQAKVDGWMESMDTWTGNVDNSLAELKSLVDSLCEQQDAAYYNATYDEAMDEEASEDEDLENFTRGDPSEG